MSDDADEMSRARLQGAIERLLTMCENIIAQRPVNPYGCICPPRSEETCKGLLCPRKTIHVT